MQKDQLSFAIDKLRQLREEVCQQQMKDDESFHINPNEAGYMSEDSIRITPYG